MEFDHLQVLNEVSFRHLQLHPRDVHTLENLGLISLRDLVDCNSVRLKGQESLLPVVRHHALILSKHVHNADIHWSSFWNEEEIDLHWMAMSFNVPFDDNILGRTLTSLEDDCGALIRIPQALGLRTLGEVIACFEEGSKPWPSYGKTKISKLGAKLEAISENPKILMDALVAEESCRPYLPDAVLAWDIDALGLGVKADTFKRHGRTTLALLLENQEELWRVPSVGRRTVELIHNRVATLAAAVINNEIDLDRLAEIQGVAIIPEERYFDDGQITAVISKLIRLVSQEDKSEVASFIADYRICIAGSETATLEAIALMAKVKITRERVRQIEKRILGKVASLLMKPFPEIGKTVVRSDLKIRFRNLSIALAERDEITPANLGILISTEWNCTVADAFRVLPMVMAIIEGTARSSAELKRLGDSPDRFFYPIEGVAGKWRVQNIGAERNLSLKLEELGITTIDNLRLAWIDGQDFGRHSEYIERVLTVACSDHLHNDHLDNMVFANRFGDSMGRAIVPAEKSNWANYVGSVREDVMSIIHNGTFWSDAQLIFDLRTSRLPNERLTMEALGEKIGRLGVTIKRTETDTLERLASVILDGQEGFAQCIIQPDWIEMWRELKRTYQRFPTDQRMFRRSVEEAYDFDDLELTMAMPTIWAILSGLPTRKIHGKTKVETAKSNHVLAPIKLAGFRAVH